MSNFSEISKLTRNKVVQKKFLKKLIVECNKLFNIVKKRRKTTWVQEAYLHCDSCFI